jgi:hypothetical protein
MNVLRRTPIAALVVAAALTVPTAAQAQQQIDDRRSASPNVNIEIDDIIVGHIVIIGGSDNEVVVTGTIGADIDEFVIEGGPDHVEIYAEFEDWDNSHNEHGRRRWRGREQTDVEVNLEIHVPAGASLELEGITANFDVSGVDGEVQIESVTGTVSYSGNASVVEISNVTGSITATAGNPMEVDIESVNGPIVYTGGVGVQGEINIENVNGSIELNVPADIAARFHVETLMGGIENAFGQKPERESRWVQSEELRFTNGAGGAEIRIETLQGGVRIHKQ